MREPLSVLVPTKNEIANVRACIESVRWADEVVVVDSGSTDGTVEVARKAADRVLEHEYVNSAAQKNWALPQLTHRWALIVDADERVTPALRAEIESVLANASREDGYTLNSFPLVFLGREGDSEHQVALPLFWHLADKESSTTVVPPDMYARLDERGNIVLTAE